METNFDLAKPRHSEQILPVPSIIQFVQIQTSFSLLFRLFLLEAEEIRDFFLSSVIRKNSLHSHLYFIESFIQNYNRSYTTQQGIVLYTLQPSKGRICNLYLITINFNSIISNYQETNTITCSFSLSFSVGLVFQGAFSFCNRCASPCRTEERRRKLCLRELQNYAGSHEDIYVVCSIHLYFYQSLRHTCITRLYDGAVTFLFSINFQNWLAFLSLHKPLFSEHSSIYFPNSQSPGAWNNNAFCRVSIINILLYFQVKFQLYINLFNVRLFFYLFIQDISFTKVYKNAPSVFVSANHTSSGGGLDPMHNSITAWVEVSQSSILRS